MTTKLLLIPLLLMLFLAIPAQAGSPKALTTAPIFPSGVDFWNCRVVNAGPKDANVVIEIFDVDGVLQKSTSATLGMNETAVAATRFAGVAFCQITADSNRALKGLRGQLSGLDDTDGLLGLVEAR